jgi:glycosyltransferase involved in cell wall biosynthesis
MAPAAPPSRDAEGCGRLGPITSPRGCLLRDRAICNDSDLFLAPWGRYEGIVSQASARLPELSPVLESRERPEIPLVSIVVPFHNEAENVEPLYRRLSGALNDRPFLWELVCVNDGSRDGTLAALVALGRRDHRVHVHDLSRNFGKEAALTAAVEQAHGDVIVPMDADLQDPPEVIPELVAKWREGYDVVNAQRSTRRHDSWPKRYTAHLFYRVINRLSSIDIPLDTGDFRLISHAVVEALRLMPERRRFMKGMFVWVGFPTATITYDRDGRHAGRSSWSYWRLWNFAIEGITSFSQVPLRVASYLGLGVAALSILYGVFLLLRTMLYGNLVSGYPSMMVAILFLGGVQLVALGVIGEYLGRIYEETKQRPLYIIRQSWNAKQPPPT